MTLVYKPKFIVQLLANLILIFILENILCCVLFLYI